MSETIGPEGLTDSEKKETGEKKLSSNVAIVLGSGWRKPQPEGRTSPELSTESRIRLLAAGLLAQNGKVGEILITGGHTLGEDAPSEAEAIKDYLLTRFPDLAEKGVQVTTEDISLETTVSADNAIEYLNSKGVNEAFLITSSTHMLRSEKIFQDRGFKIHPLAAEFKAAQASRRHAEFIDRYLGSTHNLKNNMLELIFNSVMLIDRQGRLPKLIASKTRK